MRVSFFGRFSGVKARQGNCPFRDSPRGVLLCLPGSIGRNPLSYRRGLQRRDNAHEKNRLGRPRRGQGHRPSGVPVPLFDEARIGGPHLHALHCFMHWKEIRFANRTRSVFREPLAVMPLSTSLLNLRRCSAGRGLRGEEPFRSAASEEVSSKAAPQVLDRGFRDEANHASSRFPTPPLRASSEA